MLENWPRIGGWILESEGGYANNPHDPGGPTNRGITQKTYDAWTGRHDPVTGITRREALRIIKAQYFDTSGGSQLPSGLDYAVCDFAVNSGPARAVRMLQRQVGVLEDGIVGVHTLAAVKSFGPTDKLIKAYCASRLAWLETLKGWKYFGNAWENRIEGTTPGAQMTDIGVVDRAVMLSSKVPDIPAPKVSAPYKATGPRKPSAVVAGVVGNAQVVAPVVAAAAAPVVALAKGSGPVQYAFAGVLVLAALVGLLVLVKREVAR